MNLWYYIFLLHVIARMWSQCVSSTLNSSLCMFHCSAFSVHWSSFSFSGNRLVVFCLCPTEPIYLLLLEHLSHSTKTKLNWCLQGNWLGYFQCLWLESVITGPPTHSVGVKTSNGRWHLSSSSSVTLQHNSPGGSTRRPVVLRPVRATPCIDVWLNGHTQNDSTSKAARSFCHSWSKHVEL